MKIRIMLADDHRMFREALRIPLAAEPDIEVVAEAATGTEALALVESTKPDLLVLDIAMPGMNGIETTRRVLARLPELRIVALSGYTDRMFIDEILKAGARGYVVKSAGADELIRAIRAVFAGQFFLSPEITGEVLRNGNSHSPKLTVLGQREQQVLRLLTRGMRSTEIATELSISPATVKTHRRNIKQKLGINSTAELTRYAIREGLQSI